MSSKRFAFDEGKESAGDSNEANGKSTRVILKSVADDKERRARFVFILKIVKVAKF
jgi:hypothetical protein